MKLWNETVITWPVWGRDGGYGPVRPATNVAVFDPREGERPFLVCDKIRVSSLPERKLRFIISMHRGAETARPSKNDYERVWIQLTPFGEIQGSLEPDHDTPEWFVFKLPLRKGEHFIERSFELVGEFLGLFGIQDPEGRIRGNFDITQLTWVAQGSGWRPIKNYLRERYNLRPPDVYSWTN